MKTKFSCYLVAASVLSCVSGLVACKTVDVPDLPQNTNVSKEIDSLQAMKSDEVNRNVNMLAPTYFNKGDKALNDAIEKRNDGDNPLDEVARAKAYLTKANEVATRAEDMMQPALTARDAAVKAMAPQFVKDKLADVDEDLRDAGDDIEDNDLNDAKERVPDLAKRYYDVELQALEASHLKHAEQQISQAEDEKAEKFAPRTLKSTQDELKSLKLFIQGNRHSENEIAARAAELNKDADRLLQITREARVASNSNPESMAIKIEERDKEVAAAQEKARNANQKFNSLENEVASDKNALNERNAATEEQTKELQKTQAQLQAERDLNQRFDDVRSMFKDDEAVVYRQGNKLLIRLKGLNFPKGRAAITPENYSLLSKVQDAIKKFGVAKVTIEGHTDSTGSRAQNEKLSQERADAVQRYLVANGTVTEDMISSEGKGFEDPIATNKTKKGRQANRRVDLILAPERISR